MNKIIPLIVIALIFSVFSSISKIKENAKQEPFFEYIASDMHYVRFDFHEYVVYSGMGRAGITHSPNCECHED